MQQKVNTLVLTIAGETVTITDVMVIKSDDGLYVETTVEIATDPEGNALTQTQLSLYPWERVLHLTWTENTLIDQVKEAAMMEFFEGLEDLLEHMGDGGWEEGTPADAKEEGTDGDRRDDPNYNPYADKSGE